MMVRLVLLVAAVAAVSAVPVRTDHRVSVATASASADVADDTVDAVVDSTVDGTAATHLTSLSLGFVLLTLLLAALFGSHLGAQDERDSSRPFRSGRALSRAPPPSALA